MLRLFVLLGVLLVLCGCGTPKATTLEASQLIGQWLLPANEGFVEFSPLGSCALVSDAKAAIGNYTVESEKNVVQVRFSDGSEQRLLARRAGAKLELTLPRRQPLLCEPAPAHPELKAEGLVGRWKSDKLPAAGAKLYPSVVEFHADGVYILLLWVARRSEKSPVPYQIQEAGTYALEAGQKIRMSGFRATFGIKEHEQKKYERSIGYSLSAGELELVWQSGTGKTTLRKFQRG